MADHHDIGSVVGDARKRILEPLPPNHDEQHAHLHEWPEPNIQLGED